MIYFWVKCFQGPSWLFFQTIWKISKGTTSIERRDEFTPREVWTFVLKFQLNNKGTGQRVESIRYQSMYIQPDLYRGQNIHLHFLTNPVAQRLSVINKRELWWSLFLPISYILWYLVCDFPNNCYEVSRNHILYSCAQQQRKRFRSKFTWML